MGLSSDRMARVFTSRSSGGRIDIPNEVVSVFKTADSLRMITFNATVFLAVGAICLAYALQKGTLNLTVLSACTLAPTVAGMMTRFTIHEDN
jgi:hypothetical protein